MTIKTTYDKHLKWPARIAAELATIVACFAAAIELGYWAWWPAALIIGARQHAIGIIGHWAAHRLMLHSKLIMWVCFAPLAIDPPRYRTVHWAHHHAISNVWYDHEAIIVRIFSDRWERVRRRDGWLDAIGAHFDEALVVMATMTSLRALAIYGTLLGLLWLAIGWAALLWPLSGATGLVLVHRMRARTEHEHFGQPGKTLVTAKPGLLARWWYLPHYTWLHAEHHNRPNRAVWARHATKAVL